MNNNFLNIKSEVSLVERQRILVFFFTSIGFLLGLVVNISFGYGAKDPFLLALNLVQAVSILLLMWLYIQGTFSIYVSVILLALVIQLGTSCEMVCLAAFHTERAMEMLLANTVLLGMAMVLSLVTYIQGLQYVQTALLIVVYVICWRLSGNGYLMEFLPLLLLAYLTLSFVSHRMIRGVASLEQEKVQAMQEKDNILREKEVAVREQKSAEAKIDQMLEVLNLEKPHLFKLLKLMRRQELSDRQTGELLDLLGESSREYILTQARKMLLREGTDLKRLKEYAPELLPSEVEICRLILEDKTIPEIAKALKVAPSNISSRRTGIRAKLKLSTEANLKDELIRIARPYGEQGVKLQPSKGSRKKPHTKS